MDTVHESAQGRNPLAGEGWRGLPRVQGDVSALLAALAEAQAAAQDAEKAHDNPHFGSRYADESDVGAVWREHFAPRGLSFGAFPEHDQQGRCWLTGMVGHKAGGVLLSTVQVRVSARAPKREKERPGAADEPLPLEWLVQHGAAEEAIAMRDPQRVTAALTYYRRTLWKAMAGMTARGDDDDGNRASGRKGRATVPAWKIAKRLACPKCGVVGSVGESKDAPGEFYCWKKASPVAGCGAQPLYMAHDQSALLLAPPQAPDLTASERVGEHAPEPHVNERAQATASAGALMGLPVSVARPSCATCGTERSVICTSAGIWTCSKAKAGCGAQLARVAK